MAPPFPSRTRLGLALVLALAASPARAGPDPLAEFLQKYRCPVADRLERLYDAGDPAQDRHRFIVVALPEPKDGYVQCIFHDRETAVFCEADSFWWEEKPGAPRTLRLPAKAIAALARLGFSTDDSHGNFALDRPFPAPPDFGALADFILEALYVGYDARAEDTLQFSAPFAPGLTFGCDPVG